MGIQRLGKYEILEPLGRGGMGVVYRARDTELGRIVALKLLPDEFRDDPVRRARFLREAQAAAALNHPNIATLYEIGGLHSDSGEGISPYIAMELVEGKDLAELIAHELDPKKALQIAVQIAEGLDAAHNAGVVHRDLKPRNVRVTPAGVAKILDFGLARFEPLEATPSDGDSFHTQQGAVMGTAPYMAPEQARGEPLDGRADLFSLGVILYQMLGRSVPFRGRNIVDYVRRAESSDFTPLSDLRPDIDPLVERVVEKLLAPRPEDRYSSAHDVALMLRDVSSTGSGRVDDPTQGPTVALDESPLPRRTSTAYAPSRRVLRWLVAVSALAVVVVVSLLLRRSPPAAAEELRLAVLPFENQTEEASWDLLADGLASSLSGELSSLTEVFVLHHRLAASYLEATDGLLGLARDWRVDRIVEGVVRPSDELLEIEVSVVDVDSGRTLWFERFSGLEAELGRLESRIAERLSLALDRPAPAALAASREAASGDSAAARDHLQGLSYLATGQNERLGREERSQALEVAEYLFARAIAAEPELVVAHLDRARTLAEIEELSGKAMMLEDAISEAETAYRMEPELALSRLTLGELYRRAGRLEDAEGILGDLAEEARWQGTRVLFGSSSASSGLQATDTDQEATRLRALWQLARTRIQEGDLEAAEESIRQALELDPESWQSWEILGEIEIRRGSFVEARQSLERARSLAPYEIAPFGNLAMLTIWESGLEAAVELYDDWQGPIDATLASNMATVYYYVGRLDEAERLYLHAVSLNPVDPILRANLGDLFRLTGREAEAMAEYGGALQLVQQRLQIFPDRPQLEVNRAYLLAKLGDCGEATAVADAVSPRLTDTIENTTRLALTYGRCESREATLLAVERALAAGASPEEMRCAEEFEWLWNEPDYALLVGGDPTECGR